MLSITAAGYIGLCLLTIIVSASSDLPGLSLMISGISTPPKPNDLRILATVTNTGTRPLSVLNDPRGPLSKLPTDTFKITGANGAQPRFKGVRVKYVPVAEKEGDYRVIYPGNSVEVGHDLSEAYDFSNLSSGMYNITGNDEFYTFNATNQKITPINALSIPHLALLRLPTPLLARSPPTSNATTNAITTTRPKPTYPTHAPYTGCTPNQQAALVTAAHAAQAYAHSASIYANTVTRNLTAARYTTWFGLYTKKLHHRIAAHYAALSAGNYSTFTYDCTCEVGNTFAYVYPDDYGHIYLCGAFWQAPMVGTDSKGGTLIHESSHFTANAGGTTDYTYGQRNCEVLALARPEMAAVNADSHEYFAENEPGLP